MVQVSGPWPVAGRTGRAGKLEAGGVAAGVAAFPTSSLWFAKGSNRKVIMTSSSGLFIGKKKILELRSESPTCIYKTKLGNLLSFGLVSDSGNNSGM